MNRDLQTILLRDNPWLTAPERLESWLRESLPKAMVPRAAAKRSRSAWTETRRAHLVVGPRQAGKSTLLRAHLAEQGAPVLYVDCEQALTQAWCRSAPLFMADLEGLVSDSPTLLFDEVQHLEEAGLFLKGLVDRRYPRPILVTGSSSYHLGARTRESLAGRATRTRLLPFSLQEVIADLAETPPLLQRRAVDERLARHFIVGGYPEVWLGEDPAPILTELVESFVLRDASDRFHIQRPDALRKLLSLLARQAGSLVNYSEWASLLGISRDTVASYVALLEECHVLTTLRPYAGGKRSELTARPKVYLVDPGIRNHFVGDLRPVDARGDVGAVFESWVCSELLKTFDPPWSVHFWRSTSGAEVDFVLTCPSHLAAVEVKAQAMRRPTLPRACRSFIQAYAPRTLLVVNRSFEHQATLHQTRVRWIPAWQLPSALADIRDQS